MDVGARASAGLGRDFRRGYPAPVLATIKPDGYREALVPVRRIGRRYRRGGNEVQILGVRRRSTGPIVGPHQRDRFVDGHRLGVCDPRLLVHPNRYPRRAHRAGPAPWFAGPGWAAEPAARNATS